MRLRRPSCARSWWRPPSASRRAACRGSAARSPRLVLAVAAAAVMALIARARRPRRSTRGRSTTTSARRRRRRPRRATCSAARSSRTCATAPRVRAALSFVVADDDWMAADTTLSDVLRLVRVKRGGPGPDRAADRRSCSSGSARSTTPRFAGSRPAGRPRPAGPARVAARPSRPARRPGAAGDGRRRARRAVPSPGRVRPPGARWTRGAPRYTQFTCALIAPASAGRTARTSTMIVLRTEPEPLVIVLHGLSAGDLAALEKAAAPVLESLRIGVR